MASNKRWTLTLRCYACNGKFSICALEMERVSVLAEIAPCPHCSAKPVIDYEQEIKLHRIFDLIPEMGLSIENCTNPIRGIFLIIVLNGRPKIMKRNQISPAKSAMNVRLRQSTSN